MQTKDEALEKIKVIADILNKNNVNYIVGASCALLIHGLDVIPNDIDIVVDSNNDLQKTVKLLEDFKYEIHIFLIHKDEVIEVKVDDVLVKVNPLSAEYKYYLKRKGESEKVNKRIKMIEEKLQSSF